MQEASLKPSGESAGWWKDRSGSASALMKERGLPKDGMWVQERRMASRMIPGQLEKGLPPTELGQTVWEQQTWRQGQELSIGHDRKWTCRWGGRVWRSEGHVDRNEPLIERRQVALKAKSPRCSQGMMVDGERALPLEQNLCSQLSRATTG